MSHQAFLRSLFLFVLGATVSLAAETTLRFEGSTTLEKSIRPWIAEINKAHSITLQLVPNGAGRGLEDLATGKAQVAMFAGSLPYFINQINEKTPGTVDATKLKEYRLFEMEVVIIVHKSNPIPVLTQAQIHDLFSGKVQNWKELGGPDTPVLVVIPSPSDGIRSVVTEKIMIRSAFIATARMVQTAPDMNKIVAQVPGAVAFMSALNPAPDVRVVKPDQPISVPFSFITRGEPTEPLKSVIADLEARLK